ncbi:hypothetical protein [Candidatus Nitrosocosmicus arcticus]|nr:hypothetical protein [Candidatus Nitrosocosmicus arcticus]
MNNLSLFVVLGIVAVTASIFGTLVTSVLAMSHEKMSMGMDNMSMGMDNMSMGMDNMSMPMDNMGNMSMSMDNSTGMTMMDNATMAAK